MYDVKRPIYPRTKSLLDHYDVIFKLKRLKFCTSTFHKIVFARTKFGLVQMKGSGVKRGGFCPPRPERVFEIPAWIGFKLIAVINYTEIWSFI